TASGIYRDDRDKFYQWRKSYANPNGNHANDYSKSFAIFGELTRLMFDDKVELTGGLRYFEDKQAMQEVSRLNEIVLTNPPYYFPRESKFDKVSPRVTLTWHADENLTTYASYAQGFRSGFEQFPNVYVSAPGFPAVKPDNLTNYELGAKGSTF